MNKIPFKYKLVLSILVMSITPLIINSVYSLSRFQSELEKTAYEKLDAIKESKNASISRYLETISQQITTLSHDKTVVDAARDFSMAFKNLPSANEDVIRKLKGYYTNEFATEYKNKTQKESPLDKVVFELSPQSQMLQHAFISNNSNPLGSKHLLDETPLLPEYSKFHKVYHPILREFLETFSLYDIFIVDVETDNIVYTVYKELDFTTNLTSGPYKSTNLAEVYKKAKDAADKKDYKIVDFRNYAPSYEAPASFIAAPIWDGSRKIAVLVFQMPLSTINAIMQERSGLGETGESYLVGQDKKLRSDAFNNKEMNIYNSFNKDMIVDSEYIEKALNSKPGEALTKNYDKKEVLSSYTRIKFPHLPWVIFTELETSEAFNGANIVKRNVSVFIFISLICVILISLYLTKNLSNQIETIVEDFSASAHQVQNSSQKMDLISNKLYNTVQSQISSITESVAAIDEISAMLKNNQKSSEYASELSENSKESALKGKETVDKMIQEVSEISKSYDEIQLSLEKNNEDNAKVIQVISEIAKKTTVINEIVFQTKLLSFNASVEAARAGESGKGFAVVAEEIASLAAMSGQAANEIAAMLTSSQSQVKEFAENSKKRIDSIIGIGRSKVQSGTEVADFCLAELDKILQSVNELDNSIKEINVAISEQNLGVDEVNKAMKYMENATHETTEMSERSNSASIELKEQSHALRKSIQELRKLLGAKKSYDAPELEENKDAFGNAA